MALELMVLVLLTTLILWLSILIGVAASSDKDRNAAVFLKKSPILEEVLDKKSRRLSKPFFHLSQPPLEHGLSSETWKLPKWRPVLMKPTSLPERLVLSREPERCGSVWMEEVSFWIGAYSGSQRTG